MGRIANYINRNVAIRGLSSQVENSPVNISLKVSKSAVGPSLLFQHLNFKEFTIVRNLSCLGARPVGFFESLAVTVRTNNWKNGCKDFFCPQRSTMPLK